MLEMCLSLSLLGRELIVNFLGDCVLQVKAFTQDLLNFCCDRHN